MNSKSTHAVVGLWGNDRTITRGLGQADSQVSISESKNADPGLGGPSPVESLAIGPSRGTWRTSAPAKSGA